MAVTLRQIAKRTGLSVPTVSLALNQKGYGLRDSTRAAVLSAAAELGYRPNAFARAVRAGRFGNVTVVTRSILDGHSTFFADLQQGLIGETQRRDLRLVLTELSDQKLTDPAYVPKLLRELSTDGLLILYTHDVPPRMHELLHASKLPSVWLNNDLPNDAVYCDDFRGAGDLTRVLLDLGHRRIAYACTGHSTHYSIRDRSAGYAQAMRQAGLPPRLLTVDRTLSADERHAWMRAALSAAVHERPTALITYGSCAARAAGFAAAQLGIAVPRELTIVAINQTQDEVGGQVLATLQIPFRLMGERAVTMLAEKIREPDRELPSIGVPMTLLPGDTLGPPPL